jgi:hypothetical protein
MAVWPDDRHLVADPGGVCAQHGGWRKDGVRPVRRYPGAQLSTDAGATWTAAPVASPQASTFTVTAPYQTPLETKVSPVDAVGNYSIPDTLTASACPQLFDQTGSAYITWAGGWKLNTATGYIGGSDKSASKARANATFTFSGKAVSFVTTTEPHRGIVDLAVDGTPVGSVDLYGYAPDRRADEWKRCSGHPPQRDHAPNQASDSDCEQDEHVEPWVRQMSGVEDPGNKHERTRICDRYLPAHDLLARRTVVMMSMCGWHQ